MEKGAQQEIREYANAIYELVKPLVPITMQAFEDFRINAVTLTGQDIEAIKRLGLFKLPEGDKVLESPGENREFMEKIKNLIV